MGRRLKGKESFCTQEGEGSAMDVHEHKEFWGDVVVPGMGRGGVHAGSALECRDHCQETRGCNVWVYCGDKASCKSQVSVKVQGSPLVKVATYSR